MTDTTENAIPATEPPIGQAGVDTPPAPPRKPAGGIARAALILGIIAFVLAVIPGPSFVAFLPALAAAALGVIALVKRHPRRGLALSGVILGAVALFIDLSIEMTSLSLVIVLNSRHVRALPSHPLFPAQGWRGRRGFLQADGGLPRRAPPRGSG